MPALRAALTPRLGWPITRSAAPYLASSAGVSSVEPSSTTIVSKASKSWDRTESRAVASDQARLYVGMTTLTRGAGG